MFASLANRNYRLYFVGQGISMSGTWMQSVAQGLLVLNLTGSGTALGLVTALQTLPILLFGAFGGVIADRFPKMRLLYVTQVVSATISILTGLLVLAGSIELWMVYALGVASGLVKVVENPTRQTFVRELVGTANLRNAISLNSTQINLARVIGPSIAGVLVATVGLAFCFLVDGLSRAAVIVSLMRMRRSEMLIGERARPAPGQLMEGFRYVRSSRPIRTILVMMAIIGLFTYEFSVVLPLLAEFTFDAGATGYAALTAAMGAGAVVGGLFSANRRDTSARSLVAAAAMFGLAVLVTAAAPTLRLAVLGMVLVGFTSIQFTALGNVTLQTTSAPRMQGRVMALWTVGFLGTTPIGGPLMGFIGQNAGARVALTIGGIAAIVAAGVGAWSLLGRGEPNLGTLEGEARQV